MLDKTIRTRTLKRLRQEAQDMADRIGYMIQLEEQDLPRPLLPDAPASREPKMDIAAQFRARNNS